MQVKRYRHNMTLGQRCHREPDTNLELHSHLPAMRWAELARCFFFFSSRRRHTRSDRDWSSDVCSSDLPIYDPATHQQFMGCDGNTPNVICSTDPRMQNSLAKQWFQYLPTLTSTGALNKDRKSVV